MKLRSYRKEIQNSTAQILDVFDNIVIKRQNENGTMSSIRVPCVLGGRSRVLKSLENRNKTMKLPLMAITMKSISRDPSRVFATHDGLFFGGGTNAWIHNTPIPVNIEFEMNIISKYIEDNDQLISNWCVWFSPDIFVTMPNPVYPLKKLKCQLLWNGNVSISYPSEITEDQPARIVSKTSFTFKTYLFPCSDSDEYAEKIIYTIIEDFYPVPTLLSFDTFFESALSGLIEPEFYDHLVITATTSGSPGTGYVISGHGWWDGITGETSGSTSGETSGSTSGETSGEISGDYILMENSNFILDESNGKLIVKEIPAL